MATVTDKKFHELFSNSVEGVGLLFVDYEAEINEIMAEAISEDLSKRKINEFLALVLISAGMADADITRFLSKQIAKSYDFGLKYSESILGDLRDDSNNNIQVDALISNAIIDFRAGI